MSIHYHGLSADKVADNRQRFGSNVISFPPQISLQEKTSWVNQRWQIKLLLLFCILLLLLLSTLALFSIAQHYSLWSILLVFSILLIFSYLIILLTTNWEIDSKDWRVKPLVTLLIVLNTVSSLAIYILHLPTGGASVSDFLGSGVGILIMLTIGAIYYYQQRRHEQDIKQLLCTKNAQTIRVIRNGNIVPIPRRELVVHDLIILEQGEEVPADAYLWDSCDLLVSEYPFTGLRQCHKSTEHADYDFDAAFPTNFLLAGSIVLAGEAIAEVSAVGQRTIAAQPEYLYALCSNEHFAQSVSVRPQ